MLKINNTPVSIGHFPDGTLLLKEGVPESPVTITWLYEGEHELPALIYLTRHLQSQGITHIDLKMPYIPNARMDRVKAAVDVFTLKYFAEVINALDFASVTALDPHSSVSEALLNRIVIEKPKTYIERTISRIQGDSPLMMFYPDEGSMKRYSGMIAKPYAFGIKKRDWETGEILGLDVSGMTEQIKGSDILIVDDICSRGGTFYFSAKRLKELGAGSIYLYVSHCENTVLEGEVLTCGLIERVFTTNSIFTKTHERIEVFDYE